MTRPGAAEPSALTADAPSTAAPVPLGHLRLHQYLGLEPGPRFLVTAAVHGNETCGTRALARLIAALDSGQLRLLKGQLTLVPVTNPRVGHDLGIFVQKHC